jgi:hypothetical protein
MFNWPIPPRTLTVRQLECVACKAFFTIAEDDITRSSSAWRTPRDGQPPDIRLRYQPDRQRRPVMSEGRADIPPDAVHFSDWDEKRYDQVICPRCGADNRNWLHVNNHPFGANLLYSPAMMTSLLLSAAIAAIAALLYTYFLLDELSLLNAMKAVILFIAILFTGWGVTRMSADSWRAVRDFQNLRQITSPRPFGGFIPAAWRNILFGILFVTLALPPLFVIGIPWVFNVIFSAIDPPPPPRPTVAQHISTAVNQLNAASAQSEGELKKQIDAAVEEVGSVQTAVESQAVQAPVAQETPDRWQPFQADGLLLFIWSPLAFLTAVMSTFITLGAVEQYAAAINRQLPKPLYHSLAHMTRVVVWEAKKSLEISADINRIQWKQVNRLEQGGVELVGMLYDEPEDKKDDQIRAQRYTIRADRWGQIIEADVRDVRVPRPPGGALAAPAHAAEEESVGRAFFREVTVTRR